MHEQILIGRKVLVVDDSPEVTGALAQAFAAAGACVTESCRGKEALQYIAWGGYDLIFVHLATAEREGTQILEFIAQSRPQLLRRTVVLTAGSLEPRARARLQYRYVSCLFLPFIARSLVSYATRALAFSDQRCAV